jgi:hypothetical protein
MVILSQIQIRGTHHKTIFLFANNTHTHTHTRYTLSTVRSFTQNT